ncbi:unnamed protein product [Adineta steineri]|uniref:Uncharacterized protein n=1 Tax=Adineta steineri TaxID=433720 RepID=A0A813U0X4_9BILA|nr:unnamed protein product [Adineta steineri]CAF0931515.1 unnamed protein product [Adineta steineri]
MPNARQEASLTQIRRLLSRWDQGSTKARRQILLDFIELHKSITEPELETEFAQSASLFFTRITSWLRITYLFGTCLNEQLRALRVFLQSSTGNKFLSEFLDVGGLFTLLEILNVNQIKDEDKRQALELLKLIADNGRVYKELICQSYGIRAIAECMAKSTTHENTQKSAQILLDSLALGNPLYIQQVYKGLIAILLSTSAKAQELAVSLLCKLQPQLERVHGSLLEPVVNLLQSFHAEVQYQAMEFIKILMSKDWNDENTAAIIAQLLINCLKDSLNQDKTDIDDDEEEEEVEEDDHEDNNKLIDSLKGGPMPIFIQQAAICKCIRLLTNQRDRFLRLNIVHLLLCVMGNESYPESQRQASLTLHFFVEKYSSVYDVVFEALGEQLFDMFYRDPDGFYSEMNSIQADVCRSNRVNMSSE